MSDAQLEIYRALDALARIADAPEIWLVDTMSLAGFVYSPEHGCWLNYERRMEAAPCDPKRFNETLESMRMSKARAEEVGFVALTTRKDLFSMTLPTATKGTTGDGDYFEANGIDDAP